MREPINHQRRWRFTFLVAIAAVELLASPFAAGQFSDPAADLNALPKGNSKRLNKPDRYAPRVFRELWGLPTPAGAKDLPESSGVPSASPGAAKSAEHEAAWPQGDGFLFDLRDDRLIIAYSGQPVAHYVFRDPKILRPYFAHLHAPNGIQVTRNHPPIPGRDATDHDTMHAGLWLGFGDINGVDFWRNKGRVEHARSARCPT